MVSTHAELADRAPEAAPAAHEVRALGKLATDAVRDGVSRIEGVHRAIARRSWWPTGPAGKPSHAIHNFIAGGAYASVRLGFDVAGAIAGTVLGEVARAARWRAPSQTPTGSTVLGVVNGFAGDRLGRQGSPLAWEMTVLHEGTRLSGHPADTRDVVPEATGDIVVFVHGLIETDRWWRWGAQRYYGEPDVSFGSRLRTDIDATPLHVRYNTGLHVADNGRALARLLDATIASWPVPVDRLTLVGHSMGGLVIRSACHIGADDGHDWVSLVKHAVYLGTPHDGALLARGAMAVGSLLGKLPEIRPFAAMLARPSAGIADLRHGTFAERGGGGESPDEWLDAIGPDVPLLPGCRHHAVTASLTRRGDTLLDRLAGDLLVQTISASGTGKRGRASHFIAEEGFALGGVHHFELLNHPAVYDQLRNWLVE
jgi:pimeloyl-ACP methyl ester carboxylesterase